MAEETMQADPAQVDDSAQQTEPQAETDWKAEAEKWKAQSREWEKKSKANKKAADELEALKAEQMTEQERAVKRAEAAEAELAKMVAKAEHDEAVRRVAEKSGVPMSLLDPCTDEEHMQAIAKEWTTHQQPAHAVPTAKGSRIVREKDDENADSREFVHKLFGKE